jgi:hypothetical protein
MLITQTRGVIILAKQIIEAKQNGAVNISGLKNLLRIKAGL